MRNILNSLIAMFLLSAAVGCSAVTDSEDSGDEVKEYVKVGDRVPAFTVETVLADGTTSSFSTTQPTDGETVIVLFHTSCSDCQRDLPLLNDYYLSHRDREGFRMVAVSREEGAESVAAFWREHGLSIPYSAQADRRIYSLFASAVIPRIYFCSPQLVVTRIDVEHYQGE